AALADAGHAVDRRLEVVREVLLPADDDEVLLTCDEVEVRADGVAAVAGVDPPVDEDLRGERRVPVVAGEQRVAAEPYRPDAAVREAPAVGVADLDLAAREDPADGDRRDAVAVRRLRDVARGEERAVDRLDRR